MSFLMKGGDKLRLEIAGFWQKKFGNRVIAREHSYRSNLDKVMGLLRFRFAMTVSKHFSKKKPPSGHFRFHYILLFVAIIGLVLFLGCGRGKPADLSESPKLDLSFKIGSLVGARIDSARAEVESSPEDPEAYFHLGEALACGLMFDEADKAFRETIARAPKNIYYLEQVGDYFLHRRQLKEAEELYLQAAQLESPKKGYYYIRAGQTALLADDLERAAKHFRKAASEQGTDYEMLIESARDLNRLDKRDLAIKILTRIESCAPETSLYKARALIEQMNLALADGDDDAARAIQEKILRESPFAEVRSAYLQTLLRKRSPTELRQKHSSTSADIPVLGYLFERENKSDSAAAYYREWANTPQRILFVAEHFEGQRRYELALPARAALIRSAETDEERDLARIKAAVVMAQCDSLSLFPYPQTAITPSPVWGAEPDLFGGAVSVFTDRGELNEYSALLGEQQTRYAGLASCWNLLEELEEGNGEIYRQALFSMAELMEDAHRIRKAENLYTEFLKTNPPEDEEIEVMFRLADIFQGLKKYDVAINTYHRIIEDHPLSERRREAFFELTTNPRLQYSFDSFEAKEREYWNEIERVEKLVESGYDDYYSYLLELYRSLASLRSSHKLNKKDVYEAALTRHPWETVFAWELVKIYNTSSPNGEKLLRKFAPWDNRFADELCRMLLRTGRIDSEIRRLEMEVASNPDDFFSRRSLADYLYWMSRYEESLPHYQAVLPHFPDHVDLRKRVSNLERSLGDTTAAIENYAALVELDPWNHEQLVAFGDLLAQSGNFASAETVFAWIVRLDPTSTKPWGELAAIYWDYYEFEKGLDVIRKARKRFGEPGLFARETAALLELEGSIEEAIDEYLQHVADDGWTSWEVYETKARLLKLSIRKDVGDKVVSRAKSAIGDNPQNGQLYLVLHDIHLERGEESKALDVLRKARNKVDDEDFLRDLIYRFSQLELRDDVESVYRRLIDLAPAEAGRWAQLGGFYAGERKFIEAAKAFDKAYELNEVKYYRERRAALLADGGKLSKALAIYDEIIAEDSLVANIYELRSNLLADMGKKDAAIEGIVAGVAAYQADTTKGHEYEIKRLREALANLYIRFGRYADALPAYERLINHDPDDVSLQRRAYLFAAEHGMVAKLVEYYEDIAQEAHKNYRWRMILYRINRWERRIPDAASQLAEAIKIEPHRGDLYLELVKLYRSVNQYEKAFKALAEAIKLSGGTEPYEDLLAELHWEAGNADSAVYWWRAPIRRQPENSWSYTNAAEELRQKALYREAVNVLDLAFQRVSLRDWEVWNIREKKASILSEAGEFEAAYNAYSEIYRHYDAKGQTYSADRIMDRIIENWCTSHTLDEAIEKYERAFANEPSNKRLGNLLVKLLLLQGNWRRAAEVITSTRGALASRYIYKEREIDSTLVEIYRDANLTPTSDANLLADYARVLMATGRIEEGRRILQLIPEKNPSNSEFWRMAAQAALEGGHLETAEWYIEQGLELASYNESRFHELRAKIALARGDTTEAVRRFREMASGGGTWEYFALTECLHNNGLDNYALEVIAEYRTAHPDESEDWYISEEFDLLEDEILKKRGDYTALFEKYRLEAKKSDWEWEAGEARKKAIRYAIEGNLIERGIAFVNESLVLSPDEPSLLKLRGELYTANEDWAKARDDFREVARQWSNNIDIHIKLAEATGKAGDKESALRLLLAIAGGEIGSSYKASQIYLVGRVILDLGYTKEAVEMASKAVRQFPTDEKSRLLLAECLISAGQPDSAAAALRAALGDLPDEDFHISIAEKLPEVWQKSGRLAGQIALLQRKLQSGAATWDDFTTLGAVFMHKKDYLSAESTYRKAIEKYSYDMYFGRMLARCYLLQGKRDKAETEAERLRFMKPNEWERTRKFIFTQGK